MKLFIEKHPEIIRLSNHFKEIETLAGRLGIGVDELIHKFENEDKDCRIQFRNMTVKRKAALKKSNTIRVV